VQNGNIRGDVKFFSDTAEIISIREMHSLTVQKIV
jgi:hypothetical protein